MKLLFVLLVTLTVVGEGQSLMAQNSFAEPTPAARSSLSPDPMVQAPQSGSMLSPAPQPQLMDLIPTYPVEDMKRAEDFYTNKLGFTLVLQAGGNYSAVGRDLVQIGLALSKGAAKGPKSSSYVNMNNIDVFYKELQARGVKMTRELKTQSTKMREFAVTDPDGNILTFGEYMGPK